MLPLLTKLPENIEIVLTPFQLQSENGNKTICAPYTILKRDNLQLLGWEGLEELKSFLQKHSTYPEICETTNYLMAGTLRVLHTKEQYVEDLPYYAGVLLEEEPLEDFSQPQDYLLKGSETGIFSWGTRPIYSQDPSQHTDRRFIKEHVWISIKQTDIIAKPTEDEIRSFFSVPYTLALPPTIL